MNCIIAYKEDYPWDVRVEKIANSLKDAGYGVTIVSANRHQRPRTELFDKMDIVRLPKTYFLPRWLQEVFNLPLWFNPLWLWTLFKTARKKNVDILIVRDLPLIRAGVWVARRTGAKTIFDMAEVYPLMYKSMHQFSNDLSFANRLLKNPSIASAYEKIATRSVDHIWVMIEESRDRLLSMGIEKNKISIVSNTPLPARSDDNATQHTENRLKIIYVGFLSSLRGLDVLIDGVARFCEGHESNNIRVDIIGEGKDKNFLLRKVRNLDLTDVVKIHGWLSQEAVDSLMKNANVGALTYRVCDHWNHTIPNKIFDYMKAGLPVLATEVKPIERIVREQQCGVICRDQDPDDIAEKLCFLMDPYERQALGENGKQAVTRKYNWRFDETQIYSDFERLSQNGYDFKKQLDL